MKIAVTSDVHLEFGPLKLTNDNNADVLVLGGDICVAVDLNEPDDLGITEMRHTERFHELMESSSKNFKNVIMIMGNHEHYHGDYAESANKIRKHLKDYSNIHFLDKEFVDIEGVRFFGGTMWTNFDCGNGPGDDYAMQMISGMMNDFRGVENSARMVSYKRNVYAYDKNGRIQMDEHGREMFHEEFHKRPAKFTPEDCYEDHQAFMKALQKVLDNTPAGMRVVVCGHHAPSKASTHPRYKNEILMNSAYSSDLTKFILDNPNIKLWTHGHTHEDFDYMVGSTRVFCNPRGYHDYEERADHFELKCVEI